MLKKLNNNKGFTIIEVMIVLAIAGLIILIVLLAVPALQRNGRNTAIKNDASAIAGAINEFQSNNDGLQPTASNQPANSTTVTVGASTQNQSSAKVQSGTTVANLQTVTAVPSAPFPTVEGNINIFNGLKCGSTSGTVEVSKRSTVVLYVTESSGSGLGRQCIDA